MQLLQHSEVKSTSTNTSDNVRPEPSYAENMWSDPTTLDYSDALKYIVEERAKRNANHNVRSLIELADIHASQNSFKLARQYYLKSLRLTNNSVQVLRKFIQLNLSRGNIEVADRFYKVLMEKSTNHSDIINYLNFILFNTNTLSKDHLSTFKKYSAEYPTNPDIRNLYGVALIKNGLVDDSYEIFRSLTDEFPNFIHGANNLGVISMARGYFEDAVESYNQALRIDSHFVHAYQNLASAFLSLKKQKKALDILIKAQNLNLVLEDKWRGNLAQLLTDIGKDQASAAKIHEDLIGRHPKNPIFLNNLGVNYQRLHRLREAAEQYKKAVTNLDDIKLPTSYPELHGVLLNNLLEASVKLNNLDDASKAADKILEILPNHVNALSYKVRTLMDEHDLDAARRLSERAYDIDRYHPEITLNLSYIYSVSDLDNERALLILENFMENGQATQVGDHLKNLFYNNLAYNLIKTGDMEQAKSYIDQASESPIVTSTKALYALYNDDPVKAIRLYDKAFNQIVDDFNRDMNILFSKYEFAKYYYEKGEYVNSLNFITEGMKFNINKTMRRQLSLLRSEVSKKMKS